MRLVKSYTRLCPRKCSFAVYTLVVHNSKTKDVQVNTGQKISVITAVAVTAIVALALASSPLLVLPRSGSSSSSLVSTSASSSSTFSSGSSSTTVSTSTVSTETSSSSSTTTSASDSGVITVYAHRVPSPHWAACFALVCNLGTGPGAAMFFDLYNSSYLLAPIQTGFANENGYNFTGLNPHASYYVIPQDCDYCHNDPHDVNFSYWGGPDTTMTDGNTTRSLEVGVGSTVHAWFVYIQLYCSYSTTTSSSTTMSSTTCATTTATSSSSTNSSTTITSSSTTSSSTTAASSSTATSSSTTTPSTT